MRIWRRLGLGLALAAFLPLSAGAGPRYVFFYQVRGAWTVLCGADEVTQEKTCELSAPPPQLGALQNVIYVDAMGGNAFRVRVQVRDLVVPGEPVRLQIDGGPTFEAPIARGEAVWQGAEAGAILRAMEGGQTVVYTVATAPDGALQPMQVPLADFNNALDLYRQVMRVHGLV